MSWQSYIDETLIGSGKVSKAAIIGPPDGGGIWATSAGGFLKPGESSDIVTLTKSPKDVFARGIKVGGVKYMGVMGDEKSIVGKKGATGVVVERTGLCVIVGFLDETIMAGSCYAEVGKLADYLRENQY